MLTFYCNADFADSQDGEGNRDREKIERERERMR
jgi:hypothetical protein